MDHMMAAAAEEESYSQYCYRVWAWLRTPNRGATAASHSAKKSLHSGREVSNSAKGIIPLTESVTVEAAQQSSQQQTLGKEKEHVQLYRLLMDYKDDFPGGKEMARLLSLFNEDGSQAYSVDTSRGYATRGAQFSPLPRCFICPACAVFHRKSTEPLPCCPQRYCKEMRCVRFGHRSVPYPFQRLCGCKYHSRIYEENERMFMAETMAQERSINMTLESRAKECSPMTAKDNNDDVGNDAAWQGLNDDWNGDGDGSDTNRDSLGMHVLPDDNKPERLYANQLRHRTDGYFVIRQGTMYVFRKPAYREGKVIGLKDNDFCHVVCADVTFTMDNEQTSSLSTTSTGESIWICDCRETGLTRLLHEAAFEGATIDSLRGLLLRVQEGTTFALCIHSLAASILVPKEARHLSAVSLPLVHLLVTNERRHIFSVAYASTVGGAAGVYVWDRAVVYQSLDKTLFCTKCPPQRARCRHIVSMINSNDCANDTSRAAPLPKRPKTSEPGTTTFRQFGCRRIPWRDSKLEELILRATELLSQGSSLSQVEVATVSSSELYHRCVCKEGIACVCGARCWVCQAPWLSESSVTYDNCILWGRSHRMNLQVPKVQCSQCATILHWDGHDSGIFRYSADNAFTYDLCINALNQAIIGQSPFAAIYKVIESDYALFGRRLTLSEATFYGLMWSFMESLEDDWSNLSSCPHCGSLQTCKELIIDGTAVAPRREFLRPEHNRVRPTVDGERIMKGTSSAERMFIPEKRVRKVLRDFTESSYDRPIDADLLMEVLSSAPYMEYLVGLCAQRETGKCFCHTTSPQAKAARGLLRALTTSTSIYGGLVKNPADVKGVLVELQATKRWSGTRVEACLRDYFPLLANLIQRCGSASEISALGLLLSRIEQKLSLNVPEGERENEYARKVSSLTEDLSRGIWLPSLDGERLFNRYAAPTRDWELYDCEKDLKGKHSTLLPGIFTLTCPHGFYLGFFLMVKPESPETVFSVLYNRFPDADRLIIYDNACKLLEYCLNREPTYFERTVFLIDRLHAAGHVGCTPGHDISSYWWAEPINSQVGEQGNAHTAKVKTQSAFMTIYHFSLYIRILISRRNLQKRGRLVESLTRNPRSREKLRELHASLTKVESEIFKISAGTCSCDLCRLLA